MHFGYNKFQFYQLLLSLDLSILLYLILTTSYYYDF